MSDTSPQAVAEVADWARSLVSTVEQELYGARSSIELALVPLLCRGHLLIEDVPGVGKTLLARALARGVGGRFRHIQCTPDLMPADILGVSVYNQATGRFTFKEGPIVANVLLVDEINRATPRTQSALLEAMAEGQVSVEGRPLALPDPFFLIATQSPIDSDGTFPLPEVQKDRFFLSISLGYPSREAERRIASARDAAERPPAPGASEDMERLRSIQERTVGVHVSEALKRYVLELVRATRDDTRLSMGVSPRGSLALYKGAQAAAALHGRDYVVPEDIKWIAPSVLANRLLVRTEYASRGLTPGEIAAELLARIEVPA